MLLMYLSQKTLGEIFGKLSTIASASNSASPVTKHSALACKVQAIGLGLACNQTANDAECSLESRNNNVDKQTHFIIN